MINKTWIAYSKVHEYLIGRLPSNSTYDDRIVGQKIGYLCVSFGIHLGDGLNFFWHKRGPYSRVLAAIIRHVEQNKEKIAQDCSEVVLRGSAISKLGKIKDIIDLRPDKCPENYWLEICASLKYLSNEMKSDDLTIVSNILINKKPFLKPYKNDFKEAWNILAH